MDRVPDGRWIERLAAQLWSPAPTPTAWIAAGQAIALGLLAPETPEWVDALAERMVGSLLLVQERTMDVASPEERVGLALAAAALSVAKPLASAACDAAISTWVGWSAGTPRSTRDVAAVTGWATLALLQRDADLAAEAVDHLVDLDPAGPGLLLHDWTVAVLQGHGLRRQIQMFHHLRTAMREDAPPALILAAALVLVDAAGQPRRRVVGWLREVARELAEEGTSRATPVPTPRRARSTR